MSKSGREALLDVRETLSVVREWSVGSLGCRRMVGRSSRISGSIREYFPDVREWLGGPPGCPGVVGSPPGCPGVVERLS